MSEPRDVERERQADAAEDREPEVIQDLDVTGDDAGNIRAGGEKVEYLPVHFDHIIISG